MKPRITQAKWNDNGTHLKIHVKEQMTHANYCKILSLISVMGYHYTEITDEGRWGFTNFPINLKKIKKKKISHELYYKLLTCLDTAGKSGEMELDFVIKTKDMLREEFEVKE